MEIKTNQDWLRALRAAGAEHEEALKDLQIGKRAAHRMKGDCYHDGRFAYPERRCRALQSFLGLGLAEAEVNDVVKYLTLC